MRFKSGLCAGVVGAALFLPPGLAPTRADGFGGGAPPPSPPPSAPPGIGVGAYAPGQGPVGTAGWNGGYWRGPTNAYGVFWGGGYYGGGGSDGGGDAARGGGSAQVFTYNHYDNRRRDGGFYGGGGVFYGDDGYSRQTPDPAEPRPLRAGERQDPHIIYLPDVVRRPAPSTRRSARQ